MDLPLNFYQKDVKQNGEHSAKIANKPCKTCEQKELWAKSGGQKRGLRRGLCPPTENKGFWRKRREWRMDTLSAKTRALLLRPLKTTKRTKMAGVTHAKTLFAKNPVFALLTTLRAKGTLISEPRFSTPCEMRFFPREKGKTAFSEQNPRQRPFSLSRVGKTHLAGGRKSGLTN